MEIRDTRLVQVVVPLQWTEDVGFFHACNVLGSCRTSLAVPGFRFHPELKTEGPYGLPLSTGANTLSEFYRKSIPTWVLVTSPTTAA